MQRFQILHTPTVAATVSPEGGKTFLHTIKKHYKAKSTTFLRKIISVCHDGNNFTQKSWQTRKY